MKREVIQPRSWFLEVVAAFAAVAALLYVSGCADAPDLRSIWRCNGTLVCEGERYEVTPSAACIGDLGVEDAYEAQVLANLRRLGLDCPDAEIVDTTCEDTGTPCVP